MIGPPKGLQVDKLESRAEDRRFGAVSKLGVERGCTVHARLHVSRLPIEFSRIFRNSESHPSRCVSYNKNDCKTFRYYSWLGLSVVSV